MFSCNFIQLTVLKGLKLLFVDQITLRKLGFETRITIYIISDQGNLNQVKQNKSQIKVIGASGLS